MTPDDLISVILGTDNASAGQRLGLSDADCIALHERWKRWSRNLNILAIEPSGTRPYDDGVQPGLTFIVDRKVPRPDLSRPIPRALRYDAIGEVPTNVIGLDDVPDALPSISVTPGASLSLLNRPDDAGRVCFSTTRTADTLVVTAGHVVYDGTAGGAQAAQKVVQAPAAIRNMAQSPVRLGSVSPADEHFGIGSMIDTDCAAVTADPLRQSSVSNQLLDGTVLRIGSQRELELASHDQRPVFVLAGRDRTNWIRGNVSRLADSGNDWREFTLDGVGSYAVRDFFTIIFSSASGAPVAKPERGDSGTAVIDQSGQILGLYFATSDRSNVGYAVPAYLVDRILKN